MTDPFIHFGRGGGGGSQILVTFQPAKPTR